MAFPVADSYSCAAGADIRAGSYGFAGGGGQSGFRATQPYLFIDVPLTTEIEVSSNNFSYQIPARIPGSEPYGIGAFGPSRDYVDKMCAWAWDNRGGDWIDLSGTRHGTTPHWSFLANTVSGGSAVYTYTADMTAALNAAFSLNRWNAYIVRNENPGNPASGGGARSAASHHQSDLPAPSIDVTYSDGSTATLKCVAFCGFNGSTDYASIGSPWQGLDENATIEFERPTKAVSSATLTLTITSHWSGGSKIAGYLADPPLNTSVVHTGVAQGYIKDAGISANAAVLLAPSLNDGLVWADQVYSINTDNLSNWSQNLVNGNTTAPEMNKLPFVAAGKWVNGNDFGFVDSGYSAEGFFPLAPGLGAIRSFTPAGPQVDGTVQPSGGGGRRMFMHLGEPDIGNLQEMYVRFYVLLGTDNRRLMKDVLMYAPYVGNWLSYAMAGGKWGFGAEHWTYTGGNNQTGGGNIGWSNRMGFAERPLDFSAGGTSFYVHSMDMIGVDSCYGGENGGYPGAMYSGQWYCIETRLKLNDVDGSQADGSANPVNAEMDLWVNGRLVASKRNFSYRKLPLNYTNPADNYPGLGPMQYTRIDQWNSVMPCFREIGHRGIALNDYQGGVMAADHDVVRFYTGVVASKSYIGPMRLS